MAARLFVNLPAGTLAYGALVDLPPEAAHHALRVLRMREGDALTLFDGSGGEWRAEIVSAGRKGATVRVGAHDVVERESPLAVHLVLATLATDAMDYAVRKVVELGVAAIEPVVSARSQGGARSGRSEHWRRIVIAACEQCGRNRVPVVATPRPLDDWLAEREPARNGVVLVPGAGNALPAFRDAGAIDVLVGPEGGFEPHEVDAAIRSGLRPAALGPRVLKAETACVAALAVLQATGGDLR